METLGRAVSEVTGKSAVYAGMGGWMDSALLAAAGIPAVILGPVGEGLHGAAEWVDLSSVRVCEEIALAAIRDFCR